MRVAAAARRLLGVAIAVPALATLGTGPVRAATATVSEAAREVAQGAADGGAVAETPVSQEVPELPPAALPSTSAPPPADPEITAEARRIASRLRCPVCEGLSIQDSPTELAREMKGVIREQLAEGRTPDEVKAYFIERYGEWVLLEPDPRGFNLLIYVVPMLVLLLGAGLVAVALRRWTRPAG